MIRDSSPEVARGLPGPYASIRSTDRPPRSAWSADQTPIVPAPTTTRSVTDRPRPRSSGLQRQRGRGGVPYRRRTPRQWHRVALEPLVDQVAVMRIEGIATLPGRLDDPRALEVRHVDRQPVRRPVRDAEHLAEPGGDERRVVSVRERSLGLPVGVVDRSGRT